MKVVFDTNVLIAAFISRGSCSDIVEYALIHHEAVTSLYILEEFKRKLIGKFKMPLKDVMLAKAVLLSKMNVVEPLKFSQQICSDPKNDPIIGTALAGESDLLVSGDKALLKIKRYEQVRIIPPGDFWKYESKQK